MEKYPPLSKKFPHFLHGGDYNPEQWKDTPEIWDQDMELMKLAHCNTMSVGIFSWAVLEPEEGVFDFHILDTIMDKLERNGCKAVLATPSGARPAWLAQNYPEVLRTRYDGIRNQFGARHNHCFTSPVYREKTQKINRMLARRYKDHPALLVWHVSNEYNGECYCPLCQEAFRSWLKEKYKGDLDELNRQWWTGFWSHTYTDWQQILPPSPLGEMRTHGLNLDWKRFVTAQTVDFMKNEVVPLKELTPDIPVTTNMMGTFPGLDYHRFRETVDVISWDSYPNWHNPDLPHLPADTAFVHDLNRSLLDGKPFMLMESTPSTQNWMSVNKLKKPGMHELSSLQAVAHGADTVQYFQWRKGRGGSEKFHGAVVDHYGGADTRVFQDVAQVGRDLEKLDQVLGSYRDSKVAIVFDWDNGWAIEDMQALKRDKKGYLELCRQYYYPFWKKGVSVDIIEMTQDFSRYDLLILPMLYLLKPETADRIGTYVKNGGTVVASYLAGQVNENDLCYLGGFPAQGLGEVFGIWAEEIDSLFDGETKQVAVRGGAVNCSEDKNYLATDYCELVHLKGAESWGDYREDFFAGMPALTFNRYGEGSAWYIAFHDQGDFSCDFFYRLIEELRLPKALELEDSVLEELENVTATAREDDLYRYIFVQNFGDKSQELTLPAGSYFDMLEQREAEKILQLRPFGVRVLRTSKE